MPEGNVEDCRTALHEAEGMADEARQKLEEARTKVNAAAASIESLG